LVVFAVTRDIWIAAAVAVGGPALELAARATTKERGSEASHLSFDLTLMLVAAGICLVFGLVDGNAWLTFLGIVGVPGAFFALWHRRGRSSGAE